MADGTPQTETRTITESDRLKLVGLLTLAGELNRDYDRLSAAVGGLVGEKDEGGGYYGIASDAVSEAGRGSAVGNADDLLRRLEIEVVPDAD